VNKVNGTLCVTCYLTTLYGVAIIRLVPSVDYSVSVNVDAFKILSTSDPSEPWARVARQGALQFRNSVPLNEQSSLHRTTNTASTRSADLPYYKSVLPSVAYACLACSTVGFPSHIRLYEKALSFGSLPRIFVL